MELQEVYCQNCGKLFPTQFEEWEWDGVVCSKECWDIYRVQKTLTKKFHGKVSRRLNIAELDPCPSLDTPVQNLISDTDIIIDRYYMPNDVEWLFRGPTPDGWPEGHGLKFPIATLITGDDVRRVYGLEAVTDLLEELQLPSLAMTREFRIKRK